MLGGFAFYPLLIIIQMAFSDVGPTNILGPWHWIGGANFGNLFSTPEIWASIIRTLHLAVVLLVGNLFVGFIAACALQKTGRLATVVLSIVVFVWAMPPIASGSVWKFLLDSDGFVNSVLKLIGLPAVGWLSSPDLVLWSIGFVLSWSALPFAILVYRGAMLAVSGELREAAALDGARYWRTQFSVILPQITPTVWLLGILTVLYSFKSFDFIFVLTKGGPGTASSTLPVWAYFQAFTGFDLSSGATIAVIAMIIVVVLTIPYVRLVRKEASLD